MTQRYPTSTNPSDSAGVLFLLDTGDHTLTNQKGPASKVPADIEPVVPGSTLYRTLQKVAQAVAKQLKSQAQARDESYPPKSKKRQS